MRTCVPLRALQGFFSNSFPLTPRFFFFFCTLRQMFFSPRAESCPKTGPHTPPPPQARAAPAPHPPQRGRRGRAHSHEPEGWPFSVSPFPFSLDLVGEVVGRTEAEDQRQERRSLPPDVSRSGAEVGSSGECRSRGPRRRSGPSRGGAPAPPPARPRRALPQHLAQRGAPSRLQRGLCQAGLAPGQAPKQ